MDMAGTYLGTLYKIPVSVEIDPTAGMSWSPDGSYLAFATSTGSDIYVLDIDTGVAQNITSTDDKIETEPAWSPKGTRIAISVGRTRDRMDISFMSSTGEGNPYLFTDSLERCGQPDWSPDAEYIAYICGKAAEGYDLFFVNQHNGLDSVDLTIGGYNLYPAWSPSGSQVAFTRSDGIGKPVYLYVVDADGTGMKPLSGPAIDIRQPEWSPDGRYIIFEKRLDDGGFGLQLLDTYTGVEKALTSAGLTISPAWKPYPEVKVSDIQPHPDCTDGWTRLEAGKMARVLGSPSDPPIRVRSEPKKADNQIGSIAPGQVVSVLEGPVCADGLVFWKIKNDAIPGRIGWAAEGDQHEYWLEPYSP